MTYYNYRKPVAAFVALLIFMQAMIPAGFMPDLQAWGQGLIRVTICTGHGPETIIVDQNQDSAPSHKNDNLAKNKFCPFSFAPNFTASQHAHYARALAYEFTNHVVIADKELSDLLANPAARPRAPPLHLA